MGGAPIDTAARSMASGSSVGGPARRFAFTSVVPTRLPLTSGLAMTLAFGG